MRPFLEYSQKLINDFLFEDYTSINIRFLAFKEKGGDFVITHFKLNFTSKMENDLRSFSSFDDKTIYIEETIEIGNLSQKILQNEDVFYYKIYDSKYNFHQKINIPPTYDNFLNIVSSRHHKNLRYYSENLMGLIYFNVLYNLDGEFYEYLDDIHIQTEGTIPEVKYPILYPHYKNHKFIIDGDIKTGNNIIEEKFGIGFSHYALPLIIIEYPIESYKFNSKRKIDGDLFRIFIKWDIKEKYEPYIEAVYFFQGEKHPIESKELIIEENLSQFKMIDFIIFWKGNDQLIPQGSRLFWKYYHSLFNIPDSKKNIKDLKSKAHSIKELNRKEVDINKNLKNTYDLSEIYRKIAIEYYRLSASSGVKYSQKVWLYRRLERKAYEKVINKYSEIKPIKEQEFQFFLRSNNLLYRDHIDNKNFVFRERQRRLKKKKSYSYIGASPFEEINVMHYNIRKAVNIINEKIRAAFAKKNYHKLLEFFEILGDLYIHQLVLILISDDAGFHFRKLNIDLELALQCYEKALKYKKKIEIPGVGILSIYIPNYMKIYNSFMEVGYLERKIEYLKQLKESSEPIKHLIEDQTSVLDTLVEELSQELEKLPISKSKLLYFLEQFKIDDLKYAMAILLKNTFFKTISEVSEELSKLIHNQVSNLENTYILLFPEFSLKSNVLWANLLPKRSGYKYNILRADNLLNQLQKCSKDKEYDFIFIDDVIGKGSQCINIINQNFTNQISQIKEIINNSQNIRFLILACIGSQESKKNISSAIPFIQSHDIHFANTIKPQDKAFASKSEIPLDLMERLKKFLENADPDYWRGKNNCEFLVVLESNTPNNSIGCLWRNESKIVPLCSRIQYPKLEL